MLVRGEREAGAIEQPPLHFDLLARATQFTAEYYIDSARSLFPRYARLGFMLMGLRWVMPLNVAMRAGERPGIRNGRFLTGRVVGIHGCGNIGKEVVRLLAPTLPGAATGNPVLRNPSTGQPYPNFTIPNVSPFATALLNKYYPLPNLPTTLGGVNYQTLVPTPSNTDGFDGRIDQIINSKQQVYARFNA